MRASDVRRVLVVGAGLMGHGIAQVFAQAGRAVILNDLTDEQLRRAVDRIRGNLDLFIQNDLTNRADADAALGRITTDLDLERAARDVDLAVEAAFESLDVKCPILERVGKAAPERAVIVSNTSGLSVNAMAPATGRPDRFIVAHFWNPPPLIPLVEVVRGEQTSEETLTLVEDFLREVRKVPVVVQKDVPGQIGNRLQYALFREALHLIETGVCTPRDVDTVIKASFGRRLPTCGMFETVDLNGTDLFYQISQYLFPDLDCAQGPSARFKAVIEEGRVGVRAGRGFRDWPGDRGDAIRTRRDEELMRWLRADPNNDYTR